MQIVSPCCYLALNVYRVTPVHCDWSGYIGGTVLARLIQDPKRSEYDITVLLRSDGKAEGFKKLGLKTVKGSLDDVEILEKLASEHDVVFQTVSPFRVFVMYR